MVAEWGDPLQVDFTFSVAKSYLSLLAGVACDRRADRAIWTSRWRASVRGWRVRGAQNGAITWRHLLQQTSEWEGELFGKSDVIDRNRTPCHEGRGAARDSRARCSRRAAFWEYNDVRVNRLSLALLRLFRRPLPEVFAERIMRPIGRHPDWALARLSHVDRWRSTGA